VIYVKGDGMITDIGDAMIFVRKGLRIAREAWEDGDYVMFVANEVMIYKDFCWQIWHPDTEDLLAYDYYIKEG
jgi:hypothetical protein